MNPRVLEILVRLESVDLEAIALRKELREVLEAEQNGNTMSADLSMFKGTTRRLLIEFLSAPNCMLSHEDIRLDVMFDEWASDSALRSMIKRARKEMKACRDCPYEIKPISKKGYKLERLGTCQIVSIGMKIPKKARKKYTTI